MVVTDLQKPTGNDAGVGIHAGLTGEVQIVPGSFLLPDSGKLLAQLGVVNTIERTPKKNLMCLSCIFFVPTAIFWKDKIRWHWEEKYRTRAVSDCYFECYTAAPVRPDWSISKQWSLHCVLLWKCSAFLFPVLYVVMDGMMLYLGTLFYV